MFGLTPIEMLLLFIAAAGIGVSKSGFAGVSMLHVLLFAEVFGSKPSTGALLPMLVTGDIIAIFFFGKKVDWTQVRKLLPASMLGVMVGALAMNYLKGPIFDFVVGLIILVLASMQTARTVQPGFFDKLPHETSFAFTLGFLAGVATMMANAAGPIVTLYLLAVGMPKLELVACSAWFFLTINVFKLPFSAFMGLITVKTLAINVLFAPAILLGILLGRWMLDRIPQKAFNILLLGFTLIAALRLLGVFSFFMSLIGLSGEANEVPTL